jgi:biopolymer transport protein ExbD
MSDIAFLLLIFFIVAATIDVDTGIGLTLPEYKPDEAPARVQKSRVIEIKILKDSLLLNGAITTKEFIQNFVSNKIREEINTSNDEKPVTLLLFDKKSVYNKYIEILDRVKFAYKTVQDDYSKKFYSKSFRLLSENDKAEVLSKIPVYITVGEMP